MSSFGEAEITASSWILGKVRALSIMAEPAIYPRLGIRLGCTLQEVADSRLGLSPFVGYELVELIGELRLASSSGIVGPVAWAGPRGTIRSASHLNESELRLVCDLDPAKLEKIEEHRNGKPPVLWLYLWPTLLVKGEQRRAEIRAIEMKIPREDWLQFLKAARYGGYEVIEIEFDEDGASRFKRALEHTTMARSRIDIGHYDEAVALCRKAIEAVGHDQKEGAAEGNLETAIGAATDAMRSKEYLGIISRIKQLAGFAHHELGSAMTFSRTEAQFIIRTTEGLMALLGRLLRSERV